MDLSGLTIDDSFARLDFEISHLEKRLCELRGLRNTLLPISSLPNEVLAKIFLICHHQDMGIESDMIVEAKAERKSRCRTRLVLSWVSQRWRGLALSYPGLWAFVTNGGLGYIQACLDRSKELHLTINLLSPPQKCIESALGAIHRTRNIAVSFNGIPARREDLNPNGVWDQPAPHLTSLSLKTVYPERGDQSRVLFSSTHPRLQHLILSDCGFAWDSSLITISASTLTTFHMINPTRLVYAETVADALRGMTSLVHCKLVRCLLSGGDVPSPENRQRIYLPNLQTFAFEQASSVNPFALLFHLDIPNSSISLQSPHAIPVPHFDTILQNLHEYWNQIVYWKDIDIRHIALNESQLTVSTSTPTVPRCDDSRNFTITLRAKSSESNTLSSILRVLSLAQCKPKSVSLRSVSRSMVHRFARFTSLRVLRLSEIYALEANDTFEWDSPDRSFPNLEVLEIDGQHCTSFPDSWTISR